MGKCESFPRTNYVLSCLLIHNDRVVEIRRNFCRTHPIVKLSTQPLSLISRRQAYHKRENSSNKSNLPSSPPEARTHTDTQIFIACVNERQTLTCRILLLGKIERAGYATNEQTNRGRTSRHPASTALSESMPVPALLDSKQCEHG